MTATPTDVDRIQALNRVSMPPASGPKRFVRDLAGLKVGDELSERQRAYIEILAWRFRRQMPRGLVPGREPVPLSTGASA